MTLNLAAAGKKLGPFSHTHRWQDVALYALAVGAGPDDLRYLLEPSPVVLPTWGVIPAFEPVFAALRETGGDLVKLLHTGQRTELLRALPASGEAATTCEVLGIWDMRVGAMVQIATETSFGGVPHARTTWSLLFGGQGGFGGERPPALLKAKPPKDVAPSFTARFATAPTQALLYRLTGDVNPIHARPEVAKAAGLPGPILHGLCTYGFAARACVDALAGGDVERFVSFDARFTAPVVPGQTLIAQGWRIEPGKVVMTVTVEETGELAIGQALLELRS